MFDSNKRLQHGLVVATVFTLVLSTSPQSTTIVNSKAVIINDRDAHFQLGTLRVCPIDSQYITPLICMFLDSCGADSVIKVFPTFNVADTIFTRSDGVTVRLADLSGYHKIYFTDSLVGDSASFFEFRNAYASVDSTGFIEPVKRAFADVVTPNDSNYLSHQDQYLGIGPSPSAIRLSEAWERTTGDPSQLIAIVDGGFNVVSELTGRIAGGANATHPGGGYFGDQTGDRGHGTPIATIIGAQANNQSLIAGMNWQGQLYAVKVEPLFDPLFSAFEFNELATGIQLAAESGAKQINMSIGFDDELWWRLIYGDVLDKACYNAWKMDISVVASKGNRESGGIDVNHVPADFLSTVAVGSVASTGLRSGFSNYGHGMQVVAPGEFIAVQDKNGDFWDAFSGTSAAAPHVTGALSLIRAANPSLTADDAEEILFRTAKDVEEHGIGFDDESGYGIIDVGAAVDFASDNDFVRVGGAHTSLVETMGPHSRQFFSNFNTNLASGLYLGVVQYSAKRWIDYSEYNFQTMPDIWMRRREALGLSFASPNNWDPWVRVVSGSQTLSGCWLETSVYYIGNNSLGQAIDKWFPCNNPDGCSSGPEVDMQVTIAGNFGLLAPVALAGVGFDALQHKQRVKLGWADQNDHEEGWIIQRKISGAGAPWMVIASIPANSSSGVIYYDATVQGKTTYHYRVSPYRENNPQLAWSPETVVTTPTFWPDNATALVTAIIGTCAGGGTGPLGFESGLIEQSSFGGGGEVDPELLAYTDEITVSWSPPANQNPFFPISHYIVQRLDQTFPFESGPVWDNITGTSITICNNPLNQSFPFKLWSVDVDGDTSMSFTTPATPAGCLPICEELPPAKITTENVLQPYSTELLGNYPSPFNPSTTIKFSLANRDHVSLTVYNILGQEVVKLINEERNPGENSVFWDGRDNSGVSVSSGIYFYRFVTGNVVQSRKMLLVK